MATRDFSLSSVEIYCWILNREVGSLYQYARRRLTRCGPPLLATELPIEAPQALTLMPQSPLCRRPRSEGEIRRFQAEMELQATSNLRDRVKSHASVRARSSSSSMTYRFEGNFEGKNLNTRRRHSTSFDLRRIRTTIHSKV